MGGKQLLSILTGRDLAIGVGITKVFCLSLWHIMKKFLEKLANISYKICFQIRKNTFKTHLLFKYLKKNGII